MESLLLLRVPLALWINDASPAEDGGRGSRLSSVSSSWLRMEAKGVLEEVEGEREEEVTET